MYSYHQYYCKLNKIYASIIDNCIKLANKLFSNKYKYEKLFN